MTITVYQKKLDIRQKKCKILNKYEINKQS